MRVGFYLFRPFHESIQKPVFDLLSQRHRCLISQDIDVLADFQPHVMVVSESIIDQLRPRFPNARFVLARHGLAGKQVAYQGARDADYLCVTSEAMKQWYLDANAAPKHEIWTIGYVQMDPLFRHDRLKTPFDLPDASQVILYAPTCDPALSSVPMIDADPVRLLRGDRDDLSLVIKPHPLIASHHPQWMAGLQTAAERHRNVHLVSDAHADVMPYLRAAGVLVTDASSVQLEYLATLRPMVLINNPQRHQSKHYDAIGFEWKWRDMGREVEDVAQLSKTVLHALHNPGELLDKRREYYTTLFGDLTDGCAAARLADKISGLDIRFAGEPDITPSTLWPVIETRRIGRRIRRLLTAPKNAA